LASSHYPSSFHQYTLKRRTNQCINISMTSQSLSIPIGFFDLKSSSSTSSRLFGALAMTDLTGQLITAPLVIAVYAVGRRWSRIDPTRCPLRPPSPSQAGHAVVMVWLVAVSLACGPFFLGGYGLQWPGTWCFRAYLFLLALVSLFTTGACNAVTAHGLLSRKLCLRTEMERRSSGGTGTDASRFAIEPAAQLLGIMAVLGVCWLPLLAHYTIVDTRRGTLSIRLASLNQILDPWVYLLFRNIVMRRVHRVICSCCHCGLGQSRLTPPGSTGAEDLRSGETE
uniref:Prostaglandin E2 receptor EP3 subtype n=1 Tax=Eptatretus burgeri TaxID=7764 RepID=A0A8C4R1Y8_EPTBU